MDHLSNVVKKAAVLFHQKLPSKSLDSYGNDEIVFSKNNVCVHSNTFNRTTVHHPGYLTLSYKHKTWKEKKVDDFTLQLTWIPNYIFKNYNNITKPNNSKSKPPSESKCISYHERNGVESTLHSNEWIPSHLSNEENSTNNSKCFFDKKRMLIRRYRMSFCEENVSDDEECVTFNENCYNAEKYEIKSYSKFSVDLGEMKSIRIFFSENSEKGGQLVITSKENRYMILHFHHCGLEKLLDILQEWNSSVCASVYMKDDKISYKHFTISVLPNKKPSSKSQFPKLSVTMWNCLMNESGQVEDEMLFRKTIFLGGLDKSLRKIIWPFLLNCYSLESTSQERNEMKKIREEKYKIVNEIKNDTSLFNSTDDNFLKQLEYLIYKDVIRTDRSHSFYIGDENPNLKIMQNILLNYAVLYNDYGYSQGMSDLLAPILLELQNEAEAFWCFVCLMKRCLFVCTPTDTDMEKNLEYLRELIRVMHKSFFKYLKAQQNGMDLLFCHRWLLLCVYFSTCGKSAETNPLLIHFASFCIRRCFKREFPFDMALQIWETCWSNYLTNYFHLFVSLAIIITYCDDVMKRKLNSDEMLFYFSSLAMRIDGQAILAKARNLLDSFRSLPEIPSMLSSLCQTCNSDIWDNPTVLVLKNTSE